MLLTATVRAGKTLYHVILCDSEYSTNHGLLIQFHVKIHPSHQDIARNILQATHENSSFLKQRSNSGTTAELLTDASSQEPPGTNPSSPGPNRAPRPAGNAGRPRASY